MEMILQMAKAHLQNVSVQRDRLMTERAELTKKIEEIEEFLKKGIQAVSEVAKVEDEKPSGEDGISEADRLANRDADRMPPTNLPYRLPTDMERHARRKDFS
jgi:DNA repair exonuclease SbcCD ATPase subunit